MPGHGMFWVNFQVCCRADWLITHFLVVVTKSLSYGRAVMHWVTLPSGLFKIAIHRECEGCWWGWGITCKYDSINTLGLY